MGKPNILILGAGPAGVGAAYQLTVQKKANVTVLEMKDRPGGNAGSFYEDGLYLDYGSHRLHPTCDKNILDDIKNILGNDLILRPRHGRIRLNGRWIHFPLKASEIVTKLSMGFSAGVAMDMLRSIIPVGKGNNSSENFAATLEANLGKTICNEFYFPYAKKIWGLEPEKISVIQAEKRVAANSFGKLLKKVFLKPAGSNSDGASVFYYPKKGFGQITDALYNEAKTKGATFIFKARVNQINIENGVAKSVVYRDESGDGEIEADYIWSTLPLTGMVRGIRPKADENIISAVDRISFRSMVLIYLFMETNRFTEFDAHYFPEADIPITRLSEIKNYSDTNKPENLTSICAELPCQFDDTIWNMPEDDLENLLRESLNKAGIPVTVPIKKVLVKRLRHAYPIYNIGFEKNYEVLNEYLNNIENLLLFGRQGLFVHDNTHHALYMAYSAVDCLESGSFNEEKWRDYREEFKSHVVVD